MESSSDRKEGGEEIASANDSEASTRATTTLKTTVRKQKAIPKTTTFHSENPCEHCENANVYENIDHVMY